MPEPPPRQMVGGEGVPHDDDIDHADTTPWGHPDFAALGLKFI